MPVKFGMMSVVVEKITDVKENRVLCIRTIKKMALWYLRNWPDPTCFAQEYKRISYLEIFYFEKRITDTLFTQGCLGKCFSEFTNSATSSLLQLFS